MLNVFAKAPTTVRTGRMLSSAPTDVWPTVSPRRTPRPLVRTESINSGSTLTEVEGKSAAVAAQDDRMQGSLVGSNVHGTYNAQRERTLWMRKPLFARPGDSGFSSGAEAAQKLEAEALRRDPFQTDFLESIQDLTKSIAPLMDRKPSNAWVLKQLMEPERFMTFRVSWKDDDNNWRMNRGYCILYSSALGPFKGPLRFDHRLTHGTVRMLGFEQVLKHALINDENLGGAVGGADLDVRDKSPEELRRFTHAFSTAISEYFGSLYSVVDKAVANGKFAAALANEASSLVFGEQGLKGKRCILSGTSKKTFTLAKQLCAIDALPISFSDSSGYLLDPEGFDINSIISLERLLGNHGRLEDFRHVSKTCSFHSISRGVSLWEEAKGDVAIPCMTSAEISSDDAMALANSGCKVVLETFDRACSDNAVRVLSDRDILFVPSKLVLAASAKCETESDEIVASKAKEKMNEIISAAQFNGFEKTNLQAGSCIVAFERLAASEMFKV